LHNGCSFHVVAAAIAMATLRSYRDFAQRQLYTAVAATEKQFNGSGSGFVATTTTAVAVLPVAGPTAAVGVATTAAATPRQQLCATATL
jgi:hypothetical protein